MPSRLRPTAPIAADAVLVGDPGRALLLAQELLEEPKMSNHARGLWAYFGATAAGGELTIQATGMGGPSAALVLGDLAELGVKRAVRVGTCLGADSSVDLGDLLVVGEALAEGGSATALGVEPGTLVAPDPGLTGQLRSELGDEGKVVSIASVDGAPTEHATDPGTAAIDMQTAPLLARAISLNIELAAILIVNEVEPEERHLAKEALEERERRAGRAASAVLSG
jgi:purine-nucleoside phosphorylase